jgi:hypothetical protein
VSFLISVILLVTNLFNGLVDVSQCNMIWLSDHKITFVHGTAAFTWLARRAPTNAAISSSLGRVNVLIGATLFLAITNDDVLFVHKYADAP